MPTDPTPHANSSQQWYEDNILKVRERAKSRCCSASIEDAGTCFEGCCDKWRCSNCGRTWIVEVGD